MQNDKSFSGRRLAIQRSCSWDKPVDLIPYPIEYASLRHAPIGNFYSQLTQTIGHLGMAAVICPDYVSQ